MLTETIPKLVAFMGSASFDHVIDVIVDVCSILCKQSNLIEENVSKSQGQIQVREK